MAVWSATLFSRTQAQLTAPTFTERGPLSFQSLKYADKLADPSVLEIAMRTSDIETGLYSYLQDPIANPSEIALYMDSTLVFVGPLCAVKIVDGKVTLTARDLREYLRWMRRVTDLASVTQDQFTTAKGLIDTYQALDYGNFGLVTSGIGTSGVSKTIALLGSNGNYLWDILTTIGESTSGFEISVNASTRAIVLTNPLRGTDRSATVVFEFIALQSVSYAWALKDVATRQMRVTKTGQVIGLTTDQVDTTAQSSFGRVYGFGVVTTTGVTQTDLDNLALNDLAISKKIAPVIDPVVYPVAGMTYGSVSPGDVVSTSVDVGIGKFSASRRIASVIVEVSGVQEHMSLEFE